MKYITKSLLSAALMAGLLILPTSALAQHDKASNKTERGLKAADFESRKIQGWNVHIEKVANDHPDLKQALTELESQLTDIKKLINPDIVSQLQLVPIWLNKDQRGGACYHPSPEWMKENKRMPEKVRSVELQSVNSFINSSKNQPMLMLHEMSHAFHHRVHDFKEPIITAAFEKAVASKSYEKVKHVGGRTVKHYALTDEKEYFAEATEAYFGKNDFYPFSREEFKEHDPDAYAMVEAVWKVNAKKGKEQ
jgi:hypothetical protein